MPNAVPVLLRLFQLTVLAAALGGCRTWRAVPASAAPRDGRAPARVTRLDGDRLVVERAVARSDTLRGEDRQRGAGPSRPFAVPLDSVRRLEVRRVSGARTAALAASVVVGATAAAWLFAFTMGTW